MEIVLKNVQKKHLPLISELAKTLKIKISDATEDDGYYLAAMKEGENTPLLNDQEKLDFISSLRAK